MPDNSNSVSPAKPAVKMENGGEVGRVARLRQQYEKGNRASNPHEFEQQRQTQSNNARAQAALYNVSATDHHQSGLNPAWN